MSFHVCDDVGLAYEMGDDMFAKWDPEQRDFTQGFSLEDHEKMGAGRRTSCDGARAVMFAHDVRDEALPEAIRARALGELEQLAECQEPPYEKEAWLYLGMLYRDGIGVEQSFATAEAWIRKAAEQEHAVAQYVLAELVMGQSPEEGERWMRRSAQWGYHRAETWMKAHFPEEMAKRREEDFAWEAALRREVERYSDPDIFADNRGWHALEALEALYRRSGAEGPKAEEVRALLDQVQPVGYGHAIVEAARRFACGMGLPKSPELAEELYQRILESDCGWAMYQLVELNGEYYGVGLPKGMSTKLYLGAAQRGIADAQYWIGSCYEYGWCPDLQKSDEEAEKWYRRAAVQGHRDAMQSLAGFYRARLKEKYAEEEYFRWMRKSRKW